MIEMYMTAIDGGFMLNVNHNLLKSYPHIVFYHNIKLLNS